MCCSKTWGQATCGRRLATMMQYARVPVMVVAGVGGYVTANVARLQSRSLVVPHEADWCRAVRILSCCDSARSCKGSGAEAACISTMPKRDALGGWMAHQRVRQKPRPDAFRASASRAIVATPGCALRSHLGAPTAKRSGQFVPLRSRDTVALFWCPLLCPAFFRCYCPSL